MNNLKIQFIDLKIKKDDWTKGRWAVPKEEIYKDIIDNSFDVVAFPITPYFKPKRKFKAKKCIYCNREFIPSNNKQIMCGFCFDINTCDNCNKVFITQHSKIKSEKIFCSHDCSRYYAYECMKDWYKKHPDQHAENMKKIHKEKDGIKFCDNCQENTMHIVGIGCINCYNRREDKRKSSSKNMKKLWENEDFKNKAWHSEFCETCQEETLHKFFTCIKCHPESIGGINYNFCETCNEITLHNGKFCINCYPEKFNFFLKNNRKIIYEYCPTCYNKTPHKYNENGELYCQVCAGEKIWCEKHQVFETISYNSDPSHGMFYKSKTRNWIIEYSEQFDYIQLLIDFKNEILDSKPIRGIYLWSIDGIPYYCGDSGDILSRSYDHMYEMWNSPEYWLNIKDDSINMNHSISLEVLEVCDNFISDQEMHERQIEWISTVKPISQKCDGTDHIIPLNQRKYNINNITEKYEERVGINV